MLAETLSAILRGFYLTLKLTRHGGNYASPLSAEEEEETIAAVERGDKGAREKLILHNMRLVAHVIKKYYTTIADQDDLLSIGTIGLVKAVDSYKSDKHVKFPTYACKCIQNEMLMHFRSLKKRNGDVSLSDTIENDGESAALTLGDTLSADDTMFEQLELVETYKIVAQFVEELTDEREKSIIKMRYGLGDYKTSPQHEVAKIHGISRSYVSRIEKRALEKLREKLESGNKV